jgi:hypothetical protein
VSAPFLPRSGVAGAGLGRTTRHVLPANRLVVSFAAKKLAARYGCGFGSTMQFVLAAKVVKCRARVAWVWPGKGPVSETSAAALPILPARAEAYFENRARPSEYRDRHFGFRSARVRPYGNKASRRPRRGVKWSQVAMPRIGPRTNLHPPTASGGNMYSQRAHLTSRRGAGR